MERSDKVAYVRFTSVYRSFEDVGESAVDPRYLIGRSAPSDGGVTPNTEICMLVAMKTTLDINDLLLANAKALAAQQRISLTRLIEEGLQLRLRTQAAAPPRGKQRLPVIKGRGGLLAGVDPLSNKAMLGALGDDA